MVAGTILGTLLVLFYAAFWEYNGIYLQSWILWICAAVIWALICIALSLGLWLLLRFAPRFFRFVQTKTAGHLKWLALEWNPRSIAVAWAVIMVLWLPDLIGSFPAYMDWDTLNMIYQFATDAPVNYEARALPVVVDAKFIDHDPIFDTLCFGAAWYLDTLLGSQGWGLFIFIALQSAFTAFALALSCCYLRRLGLSRGVSLCALVFVVFFPVFSRYAAAMLKDSLHAPFFLLYTIGYIEVFLTKGEALRSKGFAVAFSAAVLFCLLTRKTALYVIVPSLVVLLVFCKKHRLAALLSQGIPLVICLCFLPLWLYPALDVQSVGRQEPFGIAFQQVAAVAHYDPESIEPWEAQAIDKVLDYDSLSERFDPSITDPVKSTFRSESTKDDMLGFLNAYAALGMRHPLIYGATVLQANGSLYVPCKFIDVPWNTYQDEKESMDYWEGPIDLGNTKPDWAMPLHDLFSYIAYWVMRLLSVAGMIGFYGGWIPISAIVLQAFLRKREAWMLTPVALSVLSLFICPVAYARYALNLMLLAPILVGLMLRAIRLFRRGGKGKEGLWAKAD